MLLKVVKMLKKRLGIEAIERNWSEEFISNYYKIPSTLVISDGCEKIGNYAFCDCWNLKKVVIPESVESIGEFAFDGCEQAEVILRKSTKYIDIGTYAFNDCKKVKYCRKK
mgnify:CR=1 FL=1